MYIFYTNILDMWDSHIRKLMFIMRLTIVLILTTMMHITASTFAQNITYVKKDAPLHLVFKEIKKQTDYHVVWNDDKFDAGKTLNANFKNSELSAVMAMVLEGLPFTYTILKKTIVIREKPDIPVSEITDGSSNIDVRGIVHDDQDTPLAGATVAIKGTSRATRTNEKGEFKLADVDEHSILMLSYLGFESLEIKTSENLGIVKMTQHTDKLQVVEINAGYYTVKDKERTGSISSVSAETIGKQPVSNPLVALQGSAAGVYIQQSSGIPGSSVEVQIRGTNSIAAGNNPYYLVDGVPFVSQSLSSALSSGLIYNAGSSPLNVLNPQDIESIEVLKDADATAIYGSKGANGVILITTKKGKAGKTNVTANFASGISKVASKLELMNTAQYLEMRNQGFHNDGIAPGTADHDLNGAWDQTRYTDWQKELIGGTANYRNAQLSLSGGNASTQLLLSGNYQFQSNVFPGSQHYQKYSTHLSGNHKAFNDKLNAAFSIIYARDKNNQIFSDLTQAALRLAPNAPALYTADGKLNWENSTWINPLRDLESQFQAVNNTFIGNLTVSYQLLKYLSIKANVGYNDNRLNDLSYTPSTYFNPADNPTSADAFSDFNDSKLNALIAEPQIDYFANFGKGKLSAILGATLQSQLREQILMRGSGFSSDALVKNIQAAMAISIRDNRIADYKYQAIYGRLNYNYDSRYILNLTGRRDGSSRFGPGKQFANFGAIGAAWLFSNERLFRSLSAVISTGKLRATYGVAGNDLIGDYEYLDIFSASSGYNGKSGLSPTRLFNRDLGWEVNKKAEFGLELGFLNDRITFSAAYYRNRSSNQLVQYALPGTTGFASIRKNLDAVVQNTGLEIELSSLNLTKGKLKWSSSFNLSIPKNELVKFPGLETSTYATQYVIGEPLSIRKFYNYKGVNATTGLYEVEDVNADGKITALADQQVLLNTTHHFYGGWRNSFTYGYFQFGFLMHYVSQTYYDYFVSSPAPGMMGQQLPDVLNGDRQKFTAGSNPLASAAYSYFTSSDAIIRRTYYIRLKNVDISYQPKFLKSIATKFYLQGQNLFTLTDFVGLDPETYNSLPMLKTITLGAQLTF